MSDCIFCKIANGEIPSKKVYDDDMVCAFYDISPQAKIHILLIPKIHITNCDGVTEQNSIYLQRIFEAIPKIATEHKIEDNYRVISNCGKGAGQSVMHLHFHMLSDAKLSEKLV